MEEEKEKVETEMMRQARDLEMLQNTIQKSQRERENMQSEMEVLLDRINKMSDMMDKSRVGRLTTLVLVEIDVVGWHRVIPQPHTPVHNNCAMFEICCDLSSTFLNRYQQYIHPCLLKV